MTLTIEVDDEKAVDLLKQLAELNIIRLRPTDEVETNDSSDVDSFTRQKEPYTTEQQAELIALSGSLNMSSERFKQYEAFLHEIRNEWE